MSLAEVKADIQLARDQIAAASTIDELKQQLTDNLFPLLEGFVDATNDGFGEIGGVLDSHEEEIKRIGDDGIEDVLFPETLGEILAVFDQGRQLATELENLMKKADELTKKRVNGLIKAYRKNALVTQEMLTEITIPLDPEDEEPDQKAAPPTQKPAADDEDVDDEDEDDDEEDAEAERAGGEAG
jgi:hypothetical protein